MSLRLSELLLNFFSFGRKSGSCKALLHCLEDCFGRPNNNSSVEGILSSWTYRSLYSRTSSFTCLRLSFFLYFTPPSISCYILKLHREFYLCWLFIPISALLDAKKKKKKRILTHKHMLVWKYMYLHSCNGNILDLLLLVIICCRQVLCLLDSLTRCNSSALHCQPNMMLDEKGADFLLQYHSTEIHSVCFIWHDLPLVCHCLLCIR